MQLLLERLKPTLCKVFGFNYLKSPILFFLHKITLLTITSNTFIVASIIDKDNLMLGMF